MLYVPVMQKVFYFKVEDCDEQNSKMYFGNCNLRGFFRGTIRQKEDLAA